MITVEVAYANSKRQVIKALQVDNGCTVLAAIRASNILDEFPEINLSKNKVGIFSKLVSLDQILQAGDRIEIYNPLLIDPKQARLLRAQRAKQIQK